MYKRTYRGWIKHWDFILLDVLSLMLAYMAAYYLRHGTGFNYHANYYRTLTMVLPAADLVILVLFNTMHNVMTRGVYQELLQSLKQAALVLAVVSIYMFSVQFGDLVSRITIYLTAAFHFVLGFGMRMAWKPAVRILKTVKIVLKRDGAM